MAANTRTSCNSDMADESLMGKLSSATERTHLWVILVRDLRDPSWFEELEQLHGVFPLHPPRHGLQVVDETRHRGGAARQY